jgi:hypothetical protein
MDIYKITQIPQRGTASRKFIKGFDRRVKKIADIVG